MGSTHWIRGSLKEFPVVAMATKGDKGYHRDIPSGTVLTQGSRSVCNQALIKACSTNGFVVNFWYVINYISKDIL